MNRNKKAKIVIPSGKNIWQKELRIAKILASEGINVEFIPEADTAKTPDVRINGRPYEIKTPISSKIAAVERNLERALAKCPNIIFDSSKMKIEDRKIEKELMKRLIIGKGLKRIIFIDKKGRIIDINKLIQ